jgi:hypothetical protein
MKCPCGASEKGIIAFPLYDKGMYTTNNSLLLRACFELFNVACMKALQCGAELCIDETLFSSRGQGFSFKQYMPLKPAKYGLLYR